MNRIVSALAPNHPIRVAWPLRPVSGPEAILTMIALRLTTRRGVWPDDTNFGLPLDAWTVPTVPLTEIRLQVTRQVAAVAGVLEIQEVFAVRTGPVLDLATRVKVAAPAGPVEAVVGELGIFDGLTPGAWFLLLPAGHRPLFPVAA